MDPQNTAPPPAANAKQQAIERLQTANNVLVTVSNNPSVDQLAACIGLTLVLNKMGKHATAVFSGAVPSTIQFLQPEKTIEKTTDSLRDFIIALDKTKADKLRYKVEDKFVKIFITPYRTSITDKDLEFSQGDFNVDAVVALGVRRREEVDQAITAHGRILHDATVISVNTHDTSDIGAINWRETGASSLSEMLVSVAETLKPGILDAQMGTAFLTGIVAETERFSNDKTTPLTMTVSAKLMNAGANQQLIVTKLEAPKPIPKAVDKPDQAFDGKKMDELAAEVPKNSVEPPKPSDGSLHIEHTESKPPAVDLPPYTGSEDATDAAVEEIHIDDEGMLHKLEEEKAAQKSLEDARKDEGGLSGGPRLVLQPPTMGGRLTANSEPESLDPSTDPLTLPAIKPPLLKRDTPQVAISPNTLDELERSIDSPHTRQTEDIDQHREAVRQAANAGEPQRYDPVKSLGSSPLDLNLDGKKDQPNDSDGPGSPTAPPPVPPPMMPPSSPAGQSNSNSFIAL
jgi:nanoRNase/pAp phosphatase (c-di-AMP/oligoRNAs hydrolase)